jgi:FKBP-type peptidyl-prolyl cis-trans isomerase
MNKILIASASITAILFASCSGDSRFPGYDKTESGIFYKIHKAGDESKPVNEGDVIFITQVIHTDKDSLLSDSRQMDPRMGPFAIEVEKSKYSGDMFEAYKMMHAGDSITVCISAADMFAKGYPEPQKLPDFLDSTSYLKFSIRIDSVYDKKKVEEIKKQRAEMMKQQEAMREEMMKYYASKEDSLFKSALKKFKINGKPTTSGLYVNEIKKGSGPKIKAGDVVLVNYTGKMENGEIFDSSEGRPEPLTVVVASQKEGERVIDAWTETLEMMQVGSKVKILVPSMIGYGPMGNPPIPPYAPLYFEMEVVGMKSAK